MAGYHCLLEEHVSIYLFLHILDGLFSLEVSLMGAVSLVLLYSISRQIRLTHVVCSVLVSTSPLTHATFGFLSLLYPPIASFSWYFWHAHFPACAIPLVFPPPCLESVLNVGEAR